MTTPERIKVKINITAKEVNRYGNEPVLVIPDMDNYNAIQDIPLMKNPKHEKWQQAEAALRTFEIEGRLDVHAPGYILYEIDKVVKIAYFDHEYDAEILPNGKIKIID